MRWRRWSRRPASRSRRRDDEDPRDRGLDPCLTRASGRGVARGGAAPLPEGILSRRTTDPSADDRPVGTPRAHREFAACALPRHPGRHLGDDAAAGGCNERAAMAHHARTARRRHELEPAGEEPEMKPSRGRNTVSCADGVPTEQGFHLGFPGQPWRHRWARVGRSLHRVGDPRTRARTNICARRSLVQNPPVLLVFLALLPGLPFTGRVGLRVRARGRHEPGGSAWPRSDTASPPSWTLDSTRTVPGASTRASSDEP